MVKNKDVDRSGEGLKIGRALRELRHKKQITLQDLAAKTGVAKTILNEIEGGDVLPPVATLLKLSRAFNVGMASFLEDESPDMKISVTRSGERAKIKRRPHHYHEGEVDYIYESLETRMAVQTNIFPLYEVEDGIKYTINYKPKEYLAREYFDLQGRFRHLTDRDLDQIQEMVNEDWELLLRKAAERV